MHKRLLLSFIVLIAAQLTHKPVWAQTEALQVVGGILAEATGLEAAAQEITNQADATVTAAEGVVQQAGDFVNGGAVDQATELAQGVAEELAGDALNTANGIQTSAGEIQAGIGDLGTGAQDLVTAVTGGDVNGVLAAAGGLTGAAGGLISGGSDVVAGATDLANQIPGLNDVGLDTGALEDAAGNVLGTATDFVDGATEFADGLPTSIDEVAENITNAANEFAEGVINDATDAATEAATEFANEITGGAVGALGNATNDFVNALTGGGFAFNGGFLFGDFFGGGGGEVNVLVAPPCDTTTCINEPMIEVAQGEQVIFDPVNSYMEELSFEEACIDPQPTNVEVNKQVFRELELFPDTFCTNQGCMPNKGEACLE